MGVRAAAAGLLLHCAPNGAASNFSFCPSDLPVKISEVLATSYQHDSSPRRAVR
jgi:hypothetical protein